jgi:DNA-binding NarL/FixJ family response regulator
MSGKSEETLTRIILKSRRSAAPVEFDDHNLGPRELIKAINTGMLYIGTNEADDTRQWAVYDPSCKAIVVTDGPPKIALWPRHYDVLFALVDGATTDQVAYRLGICRRTVYLHIAQMKKRLDAESRLQAIARAMEIGLVCSNRS